MLEMGCLSGVVGGKSRGNMGNVILECYAPPALSIVKFMTFNIKTLLSQSLDLQWLD